MGGDIHTERVRVNGADRAAVRDDEDRAARVLRGEWFERGDDALAHLFVRLAVVPPGSAPLPACEGVGKTLRALVPREPAPGADVDLPELGQPDDLEPARSGDGLGGFPRAAEIAGVDRFELDPREPFGQ